MDPDSIVNAAFVLGLILGTVLLLAAVYNFVRHQTFGVGGSLLIVSGLMLIGLSVWTSVEFSVDLGGKVTARYNQDLGAKAAEVSGSIEQLRMQIVGISQDVAALQRANPGAAVSQQELAARVDRERAFRLNSDYSVLVFYNN